MRMRECLLLEKINHIVPSPPFCRAKYVQVSEFIFSSSATHSNQSALFRSLPTYIAGGRFFIPSYILHILSKSCLYYCSHFIFSRSSLQQEKHFIRQSLKSISSWPNSHIYFMAHQTHHTFPSNFSSSQRKYSWRRQHALQRCFRGRCLRQKKARWPGYMFPIWFSVGSTPRAWQSPSYPLFLFLLVVTTNLYTSHQVFILLFQGDVSGEYSACPLVFFL